MTDRLPILEDLGDVRGKRVLVRLDLNVPLGVDAEGTRVVTDDFRIRAALPTLTWLLNHGARVTACTHLGRPAGAPDPRYDVEPVQRVLAAMIPGVQLLENLRFSPGEKGNDPAFVAELIEDQDLFVNDAFGVCHRSDASVVGPPKFLPSAAGRLVQREVEQLGGLLDNPARPFVVIIGGAKVADKLGLLETLASRADSVLIGGAMAFTFTQALGEGTGASLVDASRRRGLQGALLNRAHRVCTSWRQRRASSCSATVRKGQPEAVTEPVGPSGPGRSQGRRPARSPTAGPATTSGLRRRSCFSNVGRRRRHGSLERADGRVRGPRFARGNQGDRRGDGRCPAARLSAAEISAATLVQLGLEDKIDHVSTGGGAHAGVCLSRPSTSLSLRFVQRQMPSRRLATRYREDPSCCLSAHEIGRESMPAQIAMTAGCWWQVAIGR